MGILFTRVVKLPSVESSSPGNYPQRDGNPSGKVPSASFVAESDKAWGIRERRPMPSWARTVHQHSNPRSRPVQVPARPCQPGIHCRRYEVGSRPSAKGTCQLCQGTIVITGVEANDACDEPVFTGRRHRSSAGRDVCGPPRRLDYLADKPSLSERGRFSGSDHVSLSGAPSISRRHAPGLTPITEVNTRVKWL